MSEQQKPKRRVVERREAGIKARPAPPPRSLPADHPARSMFREVAEAERATTPTTTPTTRTTATTPTTVAPARDFTRVANSIVREAVPGGFFTGKSKQVYDCLYAMTRGAIVPCMSVRISMQRLMARADVGSDRTLRKNLARLEAVGLVSIKEIGGTQGGNEFTVFLPEEIATPTTTTTTTPTTTATTDPYHHGHPSQNMPVVQVVESESGGGGLNVESPTGSPSAQTSFKTREEKADDEVFAGLLTRLKKAAAEITGREVSSSEADRWGELGDILVAELKIAAARAESVSSVPAFFAEHLRRRLTVKPAAPATTKPAAPTSTPAAPPVPPTDDELVEMFTSFLHQGMTVEDLDGQLSASVSPERWPDIRHAALERYERERGHVGPPR